MSPVDVVIVEAHHHCLEHIHALLRKKKIFRPWSMLHFDSHPDLACPTVPAQACFTPRHGYNDGNNDDEKNLYELLDSTASGIAEWILPLVLAGQLCAIDWIKPSSSTQLPCGCHRYQVGVIDPSYDSANKSSTHFRDLSPHARLKVDWNHPYYLDDDSVVPTEMLALNQTLELQVTELEKARDANGSLLLLLLQYNQHPWILDICLDYFTCCNPYLVDIDHVDTAVTLAFLEVMRASRCHQNQSSTSDHALLNNDYRQQVTNFRSLLRQALTCRDSNNSPLIEISQFYSSLEQCQTLVRNLQNRINQYGDHVLELVLEAIPFWNMPHVPNSIPGNHDVEKSVEAIENLLREHFVASDGSKIVPPFLITIARSSNDGFTPAQVVEEIQEAVLRMLHRVFCKDCKAKCALRVTKDYGEWEGSTI